MTVNLKEKRELESKSYAWAKEFELNNGRVPSREEFEKKFKEFTEQIFIKRNKDKVKEIIIESIKE